MGTVVIALFLIDMLARMYKNFHIGRKQQPASAKINCLFRKRFVYLIFLLKPGATLKHKHVRWNGQFLYRLKKSLFVRTGKDEKCVPNVPVTPFQTLSATKSHFRWSWFVKKLWNAKHKQMLRVPLSDVECRFKGYFTSKTVAWQQISL